MDGHGPAWQSSFAYWIADRGVGFRVALFADSWTWWTARAGFRARRESSATGGTDQVASRLGMTRAGPPPSLQCHGGGRARRGDLESRKSLTAKYPFPPGANPYGRGDREER